MAELAKICVMAARNFTLLFETSSSADLEVALRFMEAEVAWFEFFIGPFNKGQLDQMRVAFARVKAAYHDPG